MADQTEKKSPGRPPKVEFNQDHIEKQDIENIFATVPAGYAIQIHREEPEWCKGYLGKVFCSSEEPINLDMLKAKYGGTVLSLRFVNPQNKFKGSKRVIFPDPPKNKEGRVITEDDPFGYNNGKQSQQPQQQHGGGYIPPGCPPQLAAQLAAYYAGFPIQAFQAQQEPPKQNPLEAMQATQIMNMMNAQMQAQQELMKNNMAHMREMEKIRRDAEDERQRRQQQYERNRPEPMGELSSTIAIIRELNGIKSELGATDTTAEIISHGAPIIQDAISELVELQKMKVQAEIATKMGRNHSAAPPLPPRTAPKTDNSISVLGHSVSNPEKNGNGKTDPVELARQLRMAYDGLTTEQQTAVMSAFLNTSDADYETEQNLDHFDSESQNIIENSDQSSEGLLSDEDRELLEHDQSNHSEEIQDGQHSGPTETDDQSDRSSDTEGDGIPTD
jgi:hypothetical protein